MSAPADGPASRLLALDGLTVHFREAGTGEPVVLLHGWPQSSREWLEVTPHLAARFRVIAPDLRGMGDTSRPLGGYDAATVAGDVAALIGALGLERPRVVGHDLGGPVAFMLAADPALRVRQLAVLEAPLPGVSVEGLDAVTRRFWHLAFFQVPDMPEFLIQGREDAFLEHFMKDAAYDKSAITPERVAAYARAMRMPGALRAGFAYYQAFPRTAEQIADRRRRGQLAMPVLALGGEACLGDIPLRLMREVADDVRGGSVPQCGHWIAEERPDELAARLLAFFDEE